MDPDEPGNRRNDCSMIVQHAKEAKKQNIPTCRKIREKKSHMIHFGGPKRNWNCKWIICFFASTPFSPILYRATCSTHSNRDKQTFSRREQECARFVFSVLTDWLAIFFLNSHRPSLFVVETVAPDQGSVRSLEKDGGSVEGLRRHQ